MTTNSGHNSQSFIMSPACGLAGSSTATSITRSSALFGVSIATSMAGSAEFSSSATGSPDISAISPEAVALSSVISAATSTGSAALASIGVLPEFAASDVPASDFRKKYPPTPTTAMNNPINTSISPPPDFFCGAGCCFCGGVLATAGLGLGRLAGAAPAGRCGRCAAAFAAAARWPCATKRRTSETTLIHSGAWRSPRQLMRFAVCNRLNPRGKSISSIMTGINRPLCKPSSASS